MAGSSFVFSRLPDDVVLNIFFKLQDDPRNWAKLACVCTKFSSLIRNICWKTKCNSTIPAVVADLLSSSDSCSCSCSCSCSSLHKLAVCCPGLLHAGVLLGPDKEYKRSTTTLSLSSSSFWDAKAKTASDGCNWSLLDDLYLDTICNASESRDGSIDGCEDVADKTCIRVGRDFSACKRRKICRSQLSHLASGVWNLSREQGNKLLASRFRGDCLYICDWPGCAHMEEKRNYMLFRGIFKNFKQSRVWTTINDGNRSKIDLNCAFCGCKETWDLHSAFCLRRSFGYHDDGEPVVRAYVCENGHVSGAWTNMPLYT